MILQAVGVVAMIGVRSGVGWAVMQAVKKTGGPFGATLLGSVVSAAYLSHLHLAGLPAPAARLVRDSVFGGLAIAHQAGSHALLVKVRAAFTHGLDQALLVSAAQEGQDALRDPDRGPRPLPHAGIRRGDGRADLRGGRGLGEHLLPLLPDLTPVEALRDDPDADPLELFDAGLSQLEAGLPI